MQFWLMKSEPSAYSIHDLEKEGTTGWDGIRNYQARNIMRDKMQIGDLALFYHSNARPPGIVGLARVTKKGIVDHTQFDENSKYFDPKSSPDAPRWEMVEIEYLETFSKELSLKTLKENPLFENMMVIRKGMRLSIQPVEKDDFIHVCKWVESKLADQYLEVSA